MKQEKGDTEEARKMAEEEIQKMKKDHQEKVFSFFFFKIFVAVVCCLLITTKEISLSGRSDEHSCLEHGLSEMTVLRTRENDL